MRKDDLIDAIGETDAELVERVNLLRERGAAKNTAFKQKKRTWRIWTVAAVACLGLIVAGVRWRLTTDLHRGLGSKTGGEDRTGATYMSYEGPVFPLSLIDADSGITAERNLDFDFSPYIESSYQKEEGTFHTEDESGTQDSYGSKSMITDQYTLRQKERDKKVLCSYPFAASLSSLLEEKPVIRVNDQEIETELHIGPALDTFEDMEKAQEMDLSDPSSWKAYKMVIEAGYQEKAFDAFPELSMPVAVYEVKNMYGESSEEAEAPTLSLEYRLDRKKTKILCYGFQGLQRKDESKSFAEESRSVFIEGSDSAYVIVLGEDIKDYKLSAYTDGGCEKQMKNAGGDVVRSETTLGDILAKFTEREWKEHSNGIEKGDFYHLTAERLTDRYDLFLKHEKADDQSLDGALEDVFSLTEISSRIMYLTFEVPVSSEDAVMVSASMVKKASIDYQNALSGEDGERNGYDMVTTLGSDLHFSKQCVSLSHTEAIEIVSQDFGFDLEKGVTEVELDLKKEHYYIEVRKELLR